MSNPKFEFATNTRQQIPPPPWQDATMNYEMSDAGNFAVARTDRDYRATMGSRGDDKLVNDHMIEEIEAEARDLLVSIARFEGSASQLQQESFFMRLARLQNKIHAMQESLEQLEEGVTGVVEYAYLAAVAANELDDE